MLPCFLPRYSGSMHFYLQYSIYFILKVQTILHLECLSHNGELELMCSNAEIAALSLTFEQKNAVARDDATVQTMRI